MHASGALTEPDTRDFQPTDRQRAYLAACLDPKVPANVRARCVAAGVARASFYEWCANGRFLDWLRRERRRVVETELADVVAAIAGRAKAGSLEHARLFLQVAGLVGREPFSHQRRVSRLGRPFHVALGVPRPPRRIE